MTFLVFAAAALATVLAGPAHAVGGLAQVFVYDRSAGRQLPVH